MDRITMLSPFQIYLDDIHARICAIDSGKLADYIPELGKADPKWFGISVVTLDGVAYSSGDALRPFTIQSISKPFIYGAALADRGRNFVSTRVGVEPSGDAFNSISLNPQTGAPMNPMINAGAISSTSMVAGEDASAQWQRIEQVIDGFVGRKIAIDEAVYRSESETGFRNRAIAWMLKNFGIIDGDPMALLENYFRQCSLLVTCQDLAYMAATLANHGVHPLTGKIALPAEHVERVLSVMTTCGMYDYSGSWLYEVGMPAKSGVGGGIIAVVPGRFGIGIFSPLLDEKGNSVRGIETCKQISRDFDLHVYAHTSNPSSVLSRVYTSADAPSRRQPPLELRSYLQEQAHRIKYLCLNGYISIDSAEYIIRQMRSIAADTHSFILDMHKVTGISVSAARLLNMARISFNEQKITVVCTRTHGRAAVAGPLTRVLAKGDRGFLRFTDNDLAVEWCENRLISMESKAEIVARPLADSTLFRGISPALLQQIEAIAARQTFATGEQILCAGAKGDRRVFFIESGHVSVVIPTEGGNHQRIAALGPGMEFGEMALLGQSTRSASVFADSEVRCRIIEAADLDSITNQVPELKIAVLQNLAADMAVRLRGANQWIAALAD